MKVYPMYGHNNNRVSYDFDDLEINLRTGRPSILWDPEEDRDLLEGNETAFRYLKTSKGEERMIRRRKYLMGE